VNTQLTKQYIGKDDLREHLGWWTKVCGDIPQPKWVHFFIHTLDVIPKNCYLETKLRHRTIDWDEMKEVYF